MDYYRILYVFFLIIHWYKKLFFSLQGLSWLPKSLNEELISVISPLLELTTPTPEICDFLTKVIITSRISPILCVFFFLSRRIYLIGFFSLLFRKKMEGGEWNSIDFHQTLAILYLSSFLFSGEFRIRYSTQLNTFFHETYRSDFKQALTQQGYLNGGWKNYFKNYSWRYSLGIRNKLSMFI